MSGFMNKTYEQLLAEMNEWHTDEFLSYLRSDVQGLPTRVRSAFPLIEQMLEGVQLDKKEDMLKILYGIQGIAKYVQNLMDALGTYQQQRYANRSTLAERDSKVPFEEFVLAATRELRNHGSGIVSSSSILREVDTLDDPHKIIFVESIHEQAVRIVSISNSIVERAMRQMNDNSQEN